MSSLVHLKVFRFYYSKIPEMYDLILFLRLLNALLVNVAKLTNTPGMLHTLYRERPK